jgi:peptide/nickel transport system ATP-binding protein
MKETNSSMKDPLIRINSLRIQFETMDGIYRAVNDVSFEVFAGETLGIVGESGCGKSVTALSILRLLPPISSRITGGSIWFDGRNLLEVSEREIRRIRGNRISMIFQEPMTSLTPVLTIGKQLREAVELHQGASFRDAEKISLSMLEMVGIPEPDRRLSQYPHELSGGMRQRVMIAMALSCKPRLLIADEPTTALDVTIQAQILDLINDLKEKVGTAVIMITHDLGVIAESAKRVMVMYAGRVMEVANVASLFHQPLHPYTQGLLKALPRPLDDRHAIQRSRLEEINGTVPSLKQEIKGCCFAPRCSVSKTLCFEQPPALEQKTDDHWAACWVTKARSEDPIA